MKNFLILVAALLSCSLLLGTVTYLDNSGLGSPFVQPQIVASSPAQPYACALAQRGRMIYVDDSDDTAEAFLCFCGVDADDATYKWLRTADPAVDCF